MEFNFARNVYSTSISYFSPPPGNSFYAHHAAQRGGGDYRTDYTGDSLSVGRYIVQRELEKERIREEIMAEMARKQALEDEVRRDILMEKDYFQVPVIHNPYTRGGLGFADYGGVVGRMPSRHHARAHEVEVESGPPQASKGKLLILPRPKESGLVRQKMIAETTATKRSTNLPPAGVMFKSDNFSCALCQVAATSEQALNDHIRGQKHKAKAEKLNAKKPGTNSKWGKNLQKKKGKKKNFRSGSGKGRFKNQNRVNRCRNGEKRV